MKTYHPQTISILLLLMMTLLTACDNNNSETSPTVPSRSAQPAVDTAMISSTVPSRSAEAAVYTAATETGSNQFVAANDSNPIELDWDALIPEDWQPYKLMEEYNADNLSDDDPRAKELMEKMKRVWNKAPVVHDYDGKQVKLPGFVVPLELDATTIREFLLVPYYGACIHVPPPPANQTVYVVTREGQAYEGQLYDTVWVMGTMRVERVSSDLAEAGYRLEDASVIPYE